MNDNLHQHKSTKVFVIISLKLIIKNKSENKIYIDSLIVMQYLILIKSECMWSGTIYDHLIRMV